MLPVSKFPRILIYLSFGISILTLSSIICMHCGIYSAATISIGVAFILTLFALYLCATLISRLTHELRVEIEKPKISDITSDDIKNFARACSKLDKYNVLYDIDFNQHKIIAYVSMGMYTRMSVANNLDSVVLYHIIGTDTVLVKQQSEP